MKVNIEVIALIILFLINGLIGGIFLTTMNSITIPEIVASIDIVDINKDQIQMEIDIQIDNQNSFSLSVENFNVDSVMSTGKSIGDITVPGGEVASNSKKTFEAIGIYTLEGYDLKPINSTVTGTIAIGFFGLFEKEIPISMQIIASFDKIADNIDPPIIQIHAGISEIGSEGVGFSGSVEIINPNNFEIIMKNMSSNIISDSGEILGSIVIPDTAIKQKDSTEVKLEAELLYTCLNAQIVFIEFHGDVGVQLAGLSKTMTIATRADIEIPDLNEILMANEVFEFAISAEFKVRFQGIITTVGLSIYNPTNIPFEANNLVCRLYAQTDNQTSLIVEGIMNPCEISTNSRVCIRTEVTMPYLKLLTAAGPRLIPEWFALGITGEFSIQNTTQTIPISINGLIDPQIFI